MKEKHRGEEKTPSPATQRKNSLRTFIIFCLVVSLIILCSLGYRAFRLWQQSKFNGVEGFSVMFVQNDGKKAAVYTFDPEERRVTKAVFQAETTLPNLTKHFSIPVDGEVWVRTVTEKEVFPLALTNYSLYNQTKYKDISVIDVLRMWYLYGVYPVTKKEVEVITLPDDIATYETTLDGFFIDSKLERDKESITIVNGTSVSGLGGKMERMLTKIGANVISVTTSHDLIQETKIIYFGDKSYTVERLASLLGYPVEKREGTALSDILIEIGEDSQRTDKF